MAQTPAERARAYRTRRGAETRTDLAPCGTLAAWHRHLRQRAQLRRQGVTDLPPIDEACRAAARAYQASLRNRTQPESEPVNVEPAPKVEVTPKLAKANDGKLHRQTDPRTAATFYTWSAGPVALEARRRRFPDGRQRWELHHLPGSVVPVAAEPADPVGDAWTRLGDLRRDLDRFAQAIE